MVSKPWVFYPGCPIDWCSPAPRSGLRTGAHRVASQPPGRPLRWTVSSPPPKRAPRHRIIFFTDQVIREKAGFSLIFTLSFSLLYLFHYFIFWA